MDAFTSTVMSLTIGEIVGWIAGITAVFSVITEFNKKIKFNPISAVLNWVGSRTNKCVYDKINMLEQQVKDIGDRQKKIEETADEREAVCYRVRILRFSDELRRGVKHSQESFDQALNDVNNYDMYSKAHPDFVNNKAEVAKERIKAAYQKCLIDNDFL